MRMKTAKKMKWWIAVLAAIAILAAVIGIVQYRRSNVYPSLTLELGAPLPDATAFLRRGTTASYLEVPEIDAHAEGQYVLTLQTESGTRQVTLEVRDTTPPTAEDAEAQILPGDGIAPEQTLKNLSDASEVTAEWAARPELGSAGPHALSVLLRDSYGNQDVAGATVTVAEIAESVDYTIGDEKLPAVADFVRCWDGEAEIVTDLGGIDWTRPGSAPVELRVGGKTFRSTVNILDADAPEFSLLACAAEPGEILAPEDFVFLCSDVSPVEFSFETEPDTSETGTYEVTVIATDAAGNAAAQTAPLYVCEKVLHLEASSTPIYPWRLVPQFGEEYRGYSVPNNENYVPDTLGAEALTLSSWKGERVVGIQVRDTLPPEVEAPEVECYTGYSAAPEYFIKSVKDATPVTMEFIEEPDWNTSGPLEVGIRLTDLLGHSTEVTVKANFVQDRIAPTIHGASDKYYYVGDAVSYFSGVLAIDNIAPECELTVDKSAVNYREEGKYPVTYTATDPEGNSSSVTVNFTFSKPSVTDEELAAYVDEIFAEILTDDMSLCEQAEAVYNYIFTHVYYIGSTDKSDWRSNVYEGLKRGLGDCYTSCMVVYYMFDRLGVDVEIVQRYHGWTRHFWVLANLGTGWYHVDACRAGPAGRPLFMKTTAELQSYEDGGYFWRFDASLHPEVATTPFERF